LAVLGFLSVVQAEIGLFFPLLVLRPLDSADMTLPHRATTLSMLEDITADPQVLADIFVNYDCDLDSKNLFERMVKSIARTAGHGTSPGGATKGDPRRRGRSRQLPRPSRRRHCRYSAPAGRPLSVCLKAGAVSVFSCTRQKKAGASNSLSESLKCHWQHLLHYRMQHTAWLL